MRNVLISRLWCLKIFSLFQCFGHRIDLISTYESLDLTTMWDLQLFMTETERWPSTSYQRRLLESQKNFVICFCRPGNTIHSSSQPSIPTAKRRVLGCPCKTNLKANIVIQNDLKTLVSVKCTFLCVVLKMPRVEDSHFNRQNHHVSCQS